MTLFLEHSDSVCKTFDHSDKLLLNNSQTEMLWGNQECPSQRTKEEGSQESALLGTFCKNGTVWESKFERVEEIENKCAIVTPSFPNNAV